MLLRDTFTQVVFRHLLKLASHCSVSGSFLLATDYCMLQFGFQWQASCSVQDAGLPARDPAPAGCSEVQTVLCNIQVAKSFTTETQAALSSYDSLMRTTIRSTAAQVSFSVDKHQVYLAPIVPKIGTAQLVLLSRAIQLFSDCCHSLLKLPRQSCLTLPLSCLIRCAKSCLKNCCEKVARRSS